MELDTAASVLASLCARCPGWQIWTVGQSSATWHARPWPHLEDETSTDRLAAAVLHAHESAAAHWPALASADHFPRTLPVPDATGVRILSQLDGILADVRAAIRGWHVNFVPIRDAPPVWSAQPDPLLHAETADDLAELIRAAHEHGEWPALATWPDYEQSLQRVLAR